MNETLFYVLAGLSVFGALATVMTVHILRSAIYLMGVLCLSASFYVLLGAEFLAGIQILVYVGGIVVLLVFAVMLTRSDDLDEDRPTWPRKIVGAVGALSFFSVSAWLLSQSPFAEEKVLETSNVDIKSIGRALLDTGSNGYVLPFEVVSLLLLAVLIAGIVIARKEPQ